MENIRYKCRITKMVRIQKLEYVMADFRVKVEGWFKKIIYQMEVKFRQRIIDEINTYFDKIEEAKLYDLIATKCLSEESSLIL